MSLTTEAVIEGTLTADGTLVLDWKPDIPAGRVTVVLRRDLGATMPPNDPFWQRMQTMWAIPILGTNASAGGAHSTSEVLAIREEWQEHQQTLERLQNESGIDRRPLEEPNS